MSPFTPKPTVLIADDGPENIDVLAAALGDDYRIKIALSGDKCVEIAQTDSPDLILLDAMMPGMDGYQVCQMLKSRPETAGIPIIFVTALGSEHDEERGLRLGAIDYLVKPVSQPIVRARVRNHIHLKIKTDLLESLALLDGLTNIPNRRHFNDAAEAEIRRALRSNRPLTLIVADIDFFKLYNDAHGHGAGDQCLREVAGTLAGEGVFRPGDLIARYGGEEFVALLPDAGAESAALLAERFRKAIEAREIPHGHSTISPWVTVSVGYAVAHGGIGTQLDTLFEAADRQLYQAKAAGRNSVRGTLLPVAP